MLLVRLIYLSNLRVSFSKCSITRGNRWGKCAISFLIGISLDRVLPRVIEKIQALAFKEEEVKLCILQNIFRYIKVPSKVVGRSE